MLLGLLAFVGAAYLVETGLSLDAPLRLAPLPAVLLAAIPALLWLGYFHAQDRHEPEPKRFVFGVYLLGAFVAAPVADFATTLVLAPRLAAPIHFDPLSAERVVAAIAVVGVAQELCKYAVVRYSLYSSAELDEPLDAILYLTCAGIGFATYENVQYLQGHRGEVFLSTGVAQVVVTTLAHASFAGVLGYAVGKAKFSQVSSTVRGAMLLAGVLLAAALNGQYALIEGALSTGGLGASRWHRVAYTFGFAAAVFLVVSLLMRRLLLPPPERREEAA